MDSWQTMLGYPAILVSPWVVAIIWLVRRTPGGDGTPAPSMGEVLRRRIEGRR